MKLTIYNKARFVRGWAIFIALMMTMTQTKETQKAETVAKKTVQPVAQAPGKTIRTPAVTPTPKTVTKKPLSPAQRKAAIAEHLNKINKAKLELKAHLSSGNQELGTRIKAETAVQQVESGVLKVKKDLIKINPATKIEDGIGFEQQQFNPQLSAQTQRKENLAQANAQHEAKTKELQNTIAESLKKVQELRSMEPVKPPIRPIERPVREMIPV